MNVHHCNTDSFFGSACPNFAPAQDARRAALERIFHMQERSPSRSKAAIPQKKSIVGRKKGFTLIEIMVALSVLSISLVVLLGLRNSDIALAAKGRSIIEATILARQKITEISSAGFPSLGEAQGDFAEEFPQYTWRQTVVQTPFEQVRELYLEIVWKNNTQEERVGVTTYLFDHKGTNKVIPAQGSGN